MNNKNLRNIFIVLIMAFGVFLLKVDTVYAVSCSKAATKVYSFQGVVCTSNGSGGYEHTAPETIDNQASCPSQFSGTCTSAGTYRIGNCDESYTCSDGTLVTIEGAQRCYKTFSDSCPSGWSPEDNQTVAKPTTSKCTQVTYNGSQKAIVSGATGYTWDSPYCTDVCTKTITATLNSGWKWSDGTTAPVSITCSLSKKSITPSVSCSNKTYNGNTNASCTASLSGVVSGDDVTAGGMTCAFADANIGTNKTVTCTGISISGAKSGNYSLSSTSATGTANITSAGSPGGTYTITANANGGTITTTSGWTNASNNLTATKTVSSGSTYGTLPTVTYTGKVLKEWNTKADGTGTVVTSSTTASANATIYAIWDEDGGLVTSLELTSSTLSTSISHTETIGVIVKPSNATNKNLTVSLGTDGIATVTAASSCPASFASLAQGGMVYCYDVSGVAEGTTTLTFTTQDGSNKSVSATVTVGATTIPVESISVYPKNVSLIVKTQNGAFTTSQTIGVIIKPSNATNQNLTVVSANPSIATVTEINSCSADFMNLADGGIVYCYNVTAMAPGTTQIKVKLADGSLTEQVINVTVREQVALTNMSVVQESVTLAPNKLRTLQPIITPANATNQNITWTSSNPSVADVVTAVAKCVNYTNNTYTEDTRCVSTENANSNVNDKMYMVRALSAGTATLTATTEDGSKVATVQVTVNDTVDENVITYDCNGGTGVMSSFVVSKNDKYKLDKNVCAKEGYTFKGWKIYSNSAVLKDSSSKDYEYADEAVFTNIFGSEKSNLTLKAVWVSKTVPNAKTGISKPILALLMIAMISLVVFISLHNKKVDF